MGKDAALRAEVLGHLAEGYGLWDGLDIPTPPVSERYILSDESLSAYQGEHASCLAVACQCFWLFRTLHRMTDEDPVYATLMGDYFFSVFSKNLIPLDSVALNDAFARLLSSDVEQPTGIESYKEFVRNLPAVLGT